MTSTQGRRPTGPGAYHYEDGVMAFDCLVTRHHDMRRLVALYIGPWNGKRVDRWEPVDDMPGDFVPLTKPVAAPEPSWDDAPEWAHWTAVTPDGYRRLWFGDEPFIATYDDLNAAGWASVGNESWDEIERSEGDWRTTLRRRPEVSSE